MEHTKKHATGIFFLFFFSYIIVLAIPIVVGSLIYFRAEKVIKEETADVNMALLSQMRQTIDTHIDEIDKLCTQIATNQTIRNLTYATLPLKAKDRSKIYEVVQDFSSYKSVVSVVDEFYVYLQNIDYVITSSSASNTEFFYQVYNPDSENYVDWKDNIITKNHNGQYYFTQSVLTTSEPIETLTFMHSFQFISGNTPVGNIGVIVSTEKYEAMLSGIKGISGGSAYIIDSNNHIMASNTATNIDVTDFPSYEEMVGEFGTFDVNNGKDELLVSYIASEKNDWIYVTAFPQDIILNQLDYLRTMALISIILCVVISTLLIFYLSYRNYTPLNKVIAYIDAHGEGKKEHSQKDLRYIENAVVTIVDRNNQYIEKFEQYTPVIRANIIQRLITGRLAQAGDSWDKILSFANIAFPYASFAVVLFCIESAGEGEERGYGFGLLGAMVINITEEDMATCCPDCVVHSVEMENDTVAVLLNLDGESAKVLQTKIYDMVEQVKKHIEDKYHTVMTAGIGSLCTRLQDISLSYQDAAKALDYKVLKGISTIISYDEIGQNVLSYQYSTETETRLINSVKAGDKARAGSLLDKIFDMNVSVSVSPQEIRCMYFDIAGTAVKILNDLQLGYSDVFGDALNPAEKLLECKSVQEAHGMLRGIFGDICDRINDNKKSHNDVLLNQVLAYIDTHYVDENLSQVQIADVFEISPTYLSNFFKEQTGEKMINYIAKVKVEKAKELLADNSLTINKIAQMVGCSNAMTMIRIFKKIEGITPGQYRENLHL